MTQQLFDEIADGLPPSRINVDGIIRREKRVRAARRATGMATGVIALAGVLVTGLTFNGTPVPGPASQAQAPAVAPMSAPQFLLAAAATVETRQVVMPRPDQWIYQKLATGSSDGQSNESEHWYRVDGSKSGIMDARGRLFVVPGGLEGDDRSSAQLQREVQSLPTEPETLLKLIYKRTGEPAGSERYAKAFAEIVALLSGPVVVPPKVNAALFRAMALIPDVRINQDVVDMADRHGVGISRENTASPYRRELILDRDSFAYLGDRLIVDDVSKWSATTQDAQGSKVPGPALPPNFHNGDAISQSARLANSVVNEAGQRP